MFFGPYLQSALETRPVQMKGLQGTESPAKKRKQAASVQHRLVVVQVVDQRLCAHKVRVHLDRGAEGGDGGLRLFVAQADLPQPRHGSKVARLKLQRPQDVLEGE